MDDRNIPATRVAVLVGLIAFMSSFPVRAETCISKVGAWPFGPVGAVAAVGEYAYYGSGSVFFVADVSIPGQPQILGSARLPGTIMDIAVERSFAYVSVHNAGLRVVDISDPAAPTERGFFEAEPNHSHFGSVAVSGNSVFVLWRAFVLVVDVSAPGSPIEVGRWRVPCCGVDVAAAGASVYVAVLDEGVSGIYVIDVSAPSAPAEVGFFVLPAGNLLELVIVGERAFVAEWSSLPWWSGGLHIIDISRPSMPLEVGSVEIDRAAELAVSGRYAYVVERGGPLHVIDVVSPSYPIEVGVLELSGVEVAAAQEHILMARNRPSGITVIDASIPWDPSETGFLEASGPAVRVAATGDNAYVVFEEEGLRVFDVSMPGKPTSLGLVRVSDTSGDDVSRELRDVETSEGFLYVTAQDSLAVIAVSVPAAPVQAGSCSVSSPDGLGDVEIGEGYAYVAGSTGLHVIDVTVPSDPTEVHHVDLQWGAVGVAVSGGFAYVTGHGLHIFDLSNPATPLEVGSRPFACDLWVCPPFSAVAVAGESVFVAQDFHGLRVIDVSDPVAPVELSLIDDWGRNITDVAVVGRYAIISELGIFSDHSGTMHLIDVSDPMSLTEVHSCAHGGGGFGLAVHGRRVYRAEGGVGLSAYAVNNCLAPRFPEGRSR